MAVRKMPLRHLVLEQVAAHTVTHSVLSLCLIMFVRKDAGVVILFFFLFYIHVFVPASPLVRKDAP